MDENIARRVFFLFFRAKRSVRSKSGDGERGTDLDASVVQRVQVPVRGKDEPRGGFPEPGRGDDREVVHPRLLRGRLRRRRTGRDAKNSTVSAEERVFQRGHTAGDARDGGARARATRRRRDARGRRREEKRAENRIGGSDGGWERRARPRARERGGRPAR
eukprot:31389-Pelagococcus_subviridis.AAC.12